ncbi:hypothetical protein MSAN_02144300 [Mycena sanguinolenta]|uniref:Uncharacterized protein n=1 Tax=Mycena sanguinolenta TaxID=230812 RepID=A0A8H6XEZ6_9AGAR|nr:hypothetical protein MSAN_02144300 [Mycena sanguinolenta]
MHKQLNFPSTIMDMNSLFAAAQKYGPALAQQYGPQVMEFMSRKYILPCITHSLTADSEKDSHAQQHPHVAEHTDAIDEHIQNHPEQHRPVSHEDAAAAKDAHEEIYSRVHQQSDHEKQQMLKAKGPDAVSGAIMTHVMNTKSSEELGGSSLSALLPLLLSEATKLLGPEADPGFKATIMKKVGMLALQSKLKAGGGGHGGGGGGGGVSELLAMFAK